VSPDHALQEMAGHRWRVLAWGTPAVALLALLATGPQGPLVGSFVLAGHMITLRWCFRRPARAGLRTPTRRLMATWVPRLAFLTVGSQIYVLGALPGLTILSWPLAFAGLTVGTHAYLGRALALEQAGEAVATWEKAVVGAVGCGLVLATVAAAALAWGAASLVQWILAQPWPMGAAG
jgi:hypothetical protein